jgi:hypothetical protein
LLLIQNNDNLVNIVLNIGGAVVTIYKAFSVLIGIFPKKAKQLKNEQSGVSALEFALVAPVFLLCVFGIIELCFILYTSIILERMVLDVTREMKIEAYKGTITENDIREYAISKSEGLLNADSNLFVVTEMLNNSATPQSINAPERCLKLGTLAFDGVYCAVAAPYCPAGYVLQDANLNSNCDAGGGANAGGAGSIVRYAFIYDWKMITPFGSLHSLMGDSNSFGFSETLDETPTGVRRIIAGGAIRNEY